MKAKKLIALLLALCCLVSLIPAGAVSAYAAESEVISGSGSSPIEVNPLYEGLIDISDISTEDTTEACTNDLALSNVSAIPQTDYLSESEATAALRNAMVERKSPITLNFQFNYQGATDEDSIDNAIDKKYRAIFHEALVHTGKPTEGDYLLWNYCTRKPEWSWSAKDGVVSCTIKISLEYRTTAAQEQLLDSKVDQVLNQLNLYSCSDAEKILGIYKYITANVDYDYSNDPLKYTAYKALVNGSAVCQGFAVLFYRLSLELGVDARFVAGDAGGSHGWNIVALNGKYYNLDATWDEDKSPPFQYFLRCNRHFPDHSRWPEYDSTAFNSAYPMAATNFPYEAAANAVKITSQPKSVTVPEGETATVTVGATGVGLSYEWYYKSAGETDFSLMKSFTGSTYSVTMDATHAGSQIYCVVTDQYCSYVPSDTVTLHMGSPLKITSQPTNVTVANGATATVKVVAEGDGLKYQWYFTSNASDSSFSKSGTTSATYSTVMNSDRAGRQIYCVVTDKHGNSVTSDTVTLHMAVPVKITSQPKNVTVADGAAATVKVVAEGDGLKYQWYYTLNASGSTFYKSSTTTATYSTEMNTDRDGRQIYCVVTDQYGYSVTSDTATLHMGSPVKITTQPTDVTVANGATAKTTVKATGDGLTYQWYFTDNASDSSFSKSGTTAATYSTVMNSDRAGRQIYCVVTDKHGNSVTSDTVTLHMAVPVKITSQPKNVTVANGVTATVKVVAEGDGLKYQWYFTSNASDSSFSKSGTTAATYSTEMNADRDGRKVYCVVTDKYGNSVTSNTVTLSMGTALKITSQPTNVTVANGATAKTTVKATGDGLTYQWYFTSNASDSSFSKSGTTAATYSTEMNADRDGRKVYCVVTDQYGNSVTSDTVTLHMAVPVKITSQPKNVTVPEGETANVTLVASGDGLTYQWYFTSNASDSSFSKSGTTSATYSTVMNTDRDGRQVYCVVTDQYGYSVTSDTATLHMGSPVKITTQPTNVTVANGVTATVKVVAEGEGLKYQWYYTPNASDSTFYKSSTTTATYSTTMNADRDGREIYCVITDKYGNSVTSDTVTLHMAIPVKITSQPKSVTVPEGETANVTLVASGDGLTYQWYWKPNEETEPSLMESFTGSTYSVTMDATHAGTQVYCVVTDQYGYSVTSDTATLHMGSPVKITTQPTDVTVANGVTAKTTVKATGDGLRYRWYYTLNASDKFFTESNKTSSTYSVVMSAGKDGRRVYCVVTDKYGNSVKSNTVTLSMMGAPITITSQPKSSILAEGKFKKVVVRAIGEDLMYQWYFKDAGASKFTMSEGHNKLSYPVEMDATCAGRQIYCLITDKYGNSVISDTVTLYMAAPVKIITQPTSVTVEEGETANLTVVATGEGSLTYTWCLRPNGASGFSRDDSFTDSTYSVTMDATHAGTQVYCVVKDSYGGFVNSDIVTLNMVTPVKITTQPTSVTVEEGDTANLTVVATGEGLTYRWYYTLNASNNTIRDSYITTATYSTVMNADSDGRRVYCVVTDQYGNFVFSDIVTLNVGSPVKITTQPTSVTVEEGETANVTLVATGEGLTYTWLSRPNGAYGFSRDDSFTDSTYSVTMDATHAGTQVYCVVKDSYGGSVTSDIVTLNMATPLKITTQPTSVTVEEGETANVTLVATGEGLTYKWYLKSNEATESSLKEPFTGSTYSVTMDAAHAGMQIYCVVTDKYGNSVTSDTVTLNMN